MNEATATPTPPEVLDAIETITNYLRKREWNKAIILSPKEVSVNSVFAFTKDKPDGKQHPTA